LAGATAVLYEDGIKIKTIQTANNGRFNFRLDINKQYIIEVAKEGLISKRIAFNTNMPEDESGRWTSEFSIGLVKFCDGVNYSVLNEPVDRVSFDSKRREFVSDRDYVSQIRPRFEKVQLDYEECVIDKYETAISNADSYYKNKDYQEAINSYRQALDIYPTESHPRKRITECETLITREENVKKVYDSTIADADALMDQGQHNDFSITYKSIIIDY